MDDFAFRNAWDMLSERAVKLFESHYATKFNSSWTSDIDPLLVLLKMLPTKAAGKRLALIESSFNKAEQKLIVFRVVRLFCLKLKFKISSYRNVYYLLAFTQKNCPISDWEQTDNKFPYILAFGDSKLKLTHFFIDVEREIINVILYIQK